VSTLCLSAPVFPLLTSLMNRRSIETCFGRWGERDKLVQSAIVAQEERYKGAAISFFGADAEGQACGLTSLHRGSASQVFSALWCMSFRAAEKRYKRYNDGRADADLSGVLEAVGGGGHFEELRGRKPGVLVSRCVDEKRQHKPTTTTQHNTTQHNTAQQHTAKMTVVRAERGCRWKTKRILWSKRSCRIVVVATTTSIAMSALVHSWRSAGHKQFSRLC
jgi:hypothetical protein